MRTDADVRIVGAGLAGLAAALREAHNTCDGHHDVASASLIEVWIDETERRTWFLFESSRHGDSSGH